MTDDEKAFQPGPWITTDPGVNRFLWEMGRFGGYAPVMAALRWKGPERALRWMHRPSRVQSGLWPVARRPSPRLLGLALVAALVAGAAACALVAVLASPRDPPGILALAPGALVGLALAPFTIAAWGRRRRGRRDRPCRSGPSRDT